jgi:hypothetical protein
MILLSVFPGRGRELSHLQERYRGEGGVITDVLSAIAAARHTPAWRSPGGSVIFGHPCAARGRGGMGILDTPSTQRWREMSPGTRSSKERKITDWARIRGFSSRYPFPFPAACGGLKGMTLLGIIPAARGAGEGPEYPAFFDICPPGRDRRISPFRARIQRVAPQSEACMGVSGPGSPRSRPHRPAQVPGRRGEGMRGRLPAPSPFESVKLSPFFRKNNN